MERISFNWVSPLLSIAQKSVLGPQDMVPIPDRDEASYLTDRLEEEWDKGTRLLPLPPV
jgi:hypothetical protein